MGRIKNIGLTAKLTVSVVLCSIIIYLLIFGLGFSLIHRVIDNEVGRLGENIVDSAVHGVDEVTRAVERTINSMDLFLRTRPDNRNEIDEMLEAVVENNEEIFGVSVSFEPYLADPKEKYFSPYCFRDNSDIKCIMLGGESYDYFTMDWYIDSKKTEGPFWTDPYTDIITGNNYLLSHSAPFYKKTADGKIFEGVVSADISLAWFQDAISKSANKYGGYAFLIEHDGTFITFPEEGYALKKTIWDIANEHNDDELKAIAKNMTDGKTGIGTIMDIKSGEKARIFYEPIQQSGWSIGVVFKEKMLLADIYFVAERMILLCIAGIIFLFAVIFLLSKRITKPLTRLLAATEQIAHGNLNADIPALGRHDEVGTLAQSFTKMQSDLKKYILELSTSIAAREKIDNELKIAHDIQMSIVPEKFPPLGLYQNIRAFGKLIPAREIGGDLYDFFETDESHTCFVVGDVSDKGMHAALIMAVVSTFLRGLSKNIRHPDLLLKLVNKEILARNTESMFVTLFCGILNNETGRFRYSSAGHPPPVIIRKDSAPEFLATDSGMVLGVNSNAEFKWNSVTLSDGDAIFMYTDGVTEAAGPDDELFGDDRLIGEFKKIKRGTPESLVDGAIDAVRNHTGDRPLSDDIAVLSFCYSSTSQNKKEKMELQIKNDLNEIPEMAAKIASYCRYLGCSRECVDEINLAIEEIVTNIINFAYNDKEKHDIVLSFERLDGKISMVIADDGRLFNPLEARDPDITLPIEDRPVGKLGIFLAKMNVDRINYERAENHNRLTLVKSIKKGEQ